MKDKNEAAREDTISIEAYEATKQVIEEFGRAKAEQHQELITPEVDALQNE